MKSALIFKCVSQTAHKIIERTSCSLISQIELIWHNSFFHVSRSLYSDEAIYVLQAQRLRWHLSFVRGTKELMLRSNVHRQKPSHCQPVFVSVSAPFQCPALRLGRPCQPQGFSAGPAPGVVGRQSLERAAACTSLVLMEKMLDTYSSFMPVIFPYVKWDKSSYARVPPLCTKMLFQATSYLGFLDEPNHINAYPCVLMKGSSS